MLFFISIIQFHLYINIYFYKYTIWRINMKLLKKLSLFCCSAVLFFSSNINAATLNTFDGNVVVADENSLMEKLHKQVDLYELNVGVLNNDELYFSPKKVNGKETSKGKLAKKNLQEFLHSCPDGEDYIINQINNYEDVAAIGYVTIDVTQNEAGEIVPDFSKQSLDLTPISSEILVKPLTTKRGAESPYGTCTLYTTVYRGAYNSSTKCYNFSTHSRVSWSEPKWIGGENYHGSGWDYLLQSLPNTFVISTDSIDTKWWHTDGGADKMWFTSEVPNENSYVSRNDGGINYIQWAIKDEARWDALGLLTAVAEIDLTVTSKGPGSTATRKIQSWYVHTWDQVSMQVGIQASSSKQTDLNLTLSSASKSWKIYAYVNFTNSNFK